jgi:predicted nucleic acid-binding protein
MRYVLDSSVAFKWVVPETDSDKADRLRDDARAAVHQLLSPDIFPAELAHALTRAERQGRILVGQARLFWVDVMTTPRAIDISSRSRIGVYDCLYVALAEREGCELVTADTRLVANLKPQYPFIVELTSL